MNATLSNSEQVFRKLAFFATFLGSLVSMCIAEDFDREKLAQRLIDVPKWAEISFETQSDTGDLLLDTGRMLAKMPTTAVRDVLVEFMSRIDTMPVAERLAHLGKIYVINRLLFAVPQWVNQDDWVPFGGWNVPIVDGRINLLYPLEVGTAGEINLAHSEPRYGGPPYRAIEEFDYFWAHYPRRGSSKE